MTLPHELPGFPLVLRDGTPILLRPVLPCDLDGIRRGYLEMSRTSRYMRFFTSGSQMSLRQARFFTQVDQATHVAWCAVDPDIPVTAGGRGYGIARFIRHPQRPDEADFAVAVIDDFQGRGLGALLLAVLHRRAAQLGVQELRGEVLLENVILRTWLPQLGAELIGSGDPSYQILRWPVIHDTACLRAEGGDAAESFADWLDQLAQLET